MIGSKAFGLLLGIRYHLLLLASVSSVLSVTFSAESAHASFSCGPYLATYRVSSLSGVSGQGVRCVQFLPTRRLLPYPHFIWYGEGYWENRKHRHVGDSYSFSGNAADIIGNGEDADGSFRDGDLIFEVDEQSSPPPTIRVTGAWNEVWTLDSSGVHSDYTSSLGSVNTCGPNFVEFNATDITGSKSGSGIRCLLEGSAAWYGEGSWDGSTYSHLGYFFNSPGRIVAGASDICEPSKFNFCNNFGWDSIVMKVVRSTDFDVTGAWSEYWQRR
jgi:hypothetical protein